MLDLPLLERISLVRRPLSQRLMGGLLAVNYHALPGVAIEVEGAERIPGTPVVFAMNHTDRYNYFPFQFYLWRRFDRFTATWVKGKYYESRFLARFMESMLQLPTVSRGYLIAKDFLAAIDSRGRPVADVEYGHISTASCILANVAMKVGRPLVYDPRRREIAGDREASQLLARAYRAPWKRPAIG